MARRAATQGAQAHRPMGGVGCQERGRVPFWHSLAKPKHAQREFFLQFLSAHVSTRSWRGEKFFEKLLSAHVVPRAPVRRRYEPKPAQNGP